MSNKNCSNVEGCDGCYGCYGCYGCDGCEGCDGCYGCRGCDGCYGCSALYYSLFCKDIQGAKFMLFNKESTKERTDEVREKIYSLWSGWRPYQTNAFDLYKEAGSWSKIDLSKLTYEDWEESWQDMPKEALDYIASLPEFNAKLFKEITGLDVKDKAITLSNGAKVSEETIREALDFVAKHK